MPSSRILVASQSRRSISTALPFFELLGGPITTPHAYLSHHRMVTVFGLSTSADDLAPFGLKKTASNLCDHAGGQLGSDSIGISTSWMLSRASVNMGNPRLMMKADTNCQKWSSKIDDAALMSRSSSVVASSSTREARAVGSTVLALKLASTTCSFFDLAGVQFVVGVTLVRDAYTRFV